jgi:hypothetical protein
VFVVLQGAAEEVGEVDAVEVGQVWPTPKSANNSDFRSLLPFSLLPLRLQDHSINFSLPRLRPAVVDIA